MGPEEALTVPCHNPWLRPEAVLRLHSREEAEWPHGAAGPAAADRVGQVDDREEVVASVGVPSPGGAGVRGAGVVEF